MNERRGFQMKPTEWRSVRLLRLARAKYQGLAGGPITWLFRDRKKKQQQGGQERSRPNMLAILVVVGILGSCLVGLAAVILMVPGTLLDLGVRGLPAAVAKATQPASTEPAASGPGTTVTAPAGESTDVPTEPVGEGTPVPTATPAAEAPPSGESPIVEQFREELRQKVWAPWVTSILKYKWPPSWVEQSSLDEWIQDAQSNLPADEGQDILDCLGTLKKFFAACEARDMDAALNAAQEAEATGVIGGEQGPVKMVEFMQSYQPKAQVPAPDGQKIPLPQPDQKQEEQPAPSPTPAAPTATKTVLELWTDVCVQFQACEDFQDQCYGPSHNMWECVAEAVKSEEELKAGKYAVRHEDGTLEELSMTEAWARLLEWMTRDLGQKPSPEDMREALKIALQLTFRAGGEPIGDLVAAYEAWAIKKGIFGPLDTPTPKATQVRRIPTVEVVVMPTSTPVYLPLPKPKEWPTATPTPTMYQVTYLYPVGNGYEFCRFSDAWYWIKERLIKRGYPNPSDKLVEEVMQTAYEWSLTGLTANLDLALNQVAPDIATPTATPYMPLIKKKYPTATPTVTPTATPYLPMIIKPGS